MIPNPFADNIVHEPRRIERSVAGLNDGPLQQILADFAHLEEGAPPRVDTRLPVASFLTSAEAGYGKSHLIGRLFQTLAGRATVVYVRPFVDSDGCWQSILLTTVQEMDFPYKNQENARGKKDSRPVEAFARGVLTHLTADLVAAGKVVAPDAQIAEEYLRRYATLGARTGADLAWEHTWTAWVKSHLQQLVPLMVAEMDARQIHLQSASTLTWLNVLGHIAFGDPDFTLRTACSDWLCARSLDEEPAGLLKIRESDRPPSDGGVSAREALSRARIFDLSRLAGFYRPFLFCFDQTENYGRSGALALSLAVLLQEMVDYCQNTQVLLTANVDSWKKRLLPHFKDGPYFARLGVPVSLEGITRAQAQEMVDQRLDAWPAEAGLKPLRNGSTLEKIYSGQLQMGIRTVLNALHGEWDRLMELPPPKEMTLEEVHAQYTNEIELQPSRLCYDPGFFKWLVRDAAAFWTEVEVTVPDSDKEYFPVQWKKGDKVIRFGFEGGCHWKRWLSIMNASAAKAAHSTSSFFFRTPEQAGMPGKTWLSRNELLSAMKSHLRVVTLTARQIASMYACRSMHSDAVQGDLDFPPDDILKFTAGKLKTWWDSQTGMPPDSQPEQGPLSRSGPSAELIENIRRIVIKAKFLSLEDLLAKLGTAWQTEEINKAIETIPELRIFPSPKMTVILWQAPVSP